MLTPCIGSKILRCYMGSKLVEVCNYLDTLDYLNIINFVEIKIII